MLQKYALLISVLAAERFVPPFAFQGSIWPKPQVIHQDDTFRWFILNNILIYFYSQPEFSRLRRFSIRFYEPIRNIYSSYWPITIEYFCRIKKRGQQENLDCMFVNKPWISFINNRHSRRSLSIWERPALELSNDPSWSRSIMLYNFTDFLQYQKWFSFYLHWTTIWYFGFSNLPYIFNDQLDDLCCRSFAYSIVGTENYYVW